MTLCGHVVSSEKSLSFKLIRIYGNDRCQSLPRLARLNAPGVLHHIMIRGLGRRKIFLDNKDREDFLERLSNLLPEIETPCYAWAFLPNHAHFLFRTGSIPLATLIRILLTENVVSFNMRYKRSGHLLRNRYPG